MSAPEGLRALIHRQALASPRSRYLEDARSNRSIDYAELEATASVWAAELNARGIAPGGSVIIDIADPLDFALVHLSVIAAGRRSVPTNPDLTEAELRRISDLLDGADLLVTDRDDRAGIGVPIVPVVPVVPAITLSSTGPAAVPGEGSALLFTSGSTGTPKGVELGERQLLFVARGIAENNQLVPTDRGYNPLPLFHVNAEVVGLLSTLVAGATIVLDRRFHRTGFWELMDERRITWLNAVPAMLAVLARGGEFAVPACLRFVRSASAPLPDAVRASLGDVPLIVSYGMTEGASQITATPLDAPPRDGSVGVPVGSEVQARAEDGTVLAAGEVGAFWIRGPGIVTSYFEGRARERFDADGWLSTGDLGYLDDDGYVYLVGRSDDVINRGGEKVYPAEVEEVLLGDARVREAVVVGKPDPILHQVPVAFVIPVSALSDSETLAFVGELFERVERELPRFKRPIDISVVNDVPRAPTGKVQRSRVRELVEQE
ncbi:class I adenylate-forming enzyme family protein [Lacisediminihabitans changchengi]|uniref:AMP-binding protein n=1 Tax=Lacisediminihabitans changchengi TaxID=2787634 RepID=A0A934VXE6_9MICO|nr:AMP-binding protein [Lacisediminihabitans changchengi]MBK4346832.1 AMP-binding protein [Lacisediminihabitans changchengi]MBK4348045.1 AMP-binding protein [Lacisediminihabitans changchengi]